MEFLIQRMPRPVKLALRHVNDGEQGQQTAPRCLLSRVRGSEQAMGSAKLDTLLQRMVNNYPQKLWGSMYAIVETGGKQYRIEPGAILRVERMAGEVGDVVEFRRVRLLHSDGDFLVGRPWVDQARVTAEITRQGRTRSIMIFKKKRRKNYRRTKGHRQWFTEVRIKEIASA
jgi:large subunit ribosomal protein L21